MGFQRRIWEQIRKATETSWVKNIYFLLLILKNWRCTVVNHTDSITSRWVWKWIQFAFVNLQIVKGTILVYWPGLFFWWARIYWPWHQLQAKFMITNEKVSKATVNHIFAFVFMPEFVKYILFRGCPNERNRCETTNCHKYIIARLWLP